MLRFQRAVESSVPVAGTSGGFWTWFSGKQQEDSAMTLGRGALLWLLGIPLPVILLLALFWR
jgi:hypothetical protein